MRFPWSARRPAVDVAEGERVLAWARTAGGDVVAGTREALYLPGGVRVRWERVESADWDVEAEVLSVSEVGSWGEQRPVHEVAVAEPRLLLDLVRERVTASVVLQRHVPVRGRRGLRVIARRAPSRHGPLSWVFEFDEGVDPDDPVVRAAADVALLEARTEVGDR